MGRGRLARVPGSHITPVYRDAVKDFEEITLGAKAHAKGEKYFNSLNFKRNSSVCLVSSQINSFLSVQFSSVIQSCPTVCDPMNCCTPGFPVHHQLPELAQTHVH